MAKPSIFSSDYEKRMKKRRRKILLMIFLIILICISIIFFINKNAKGWVKTNLHKDFNIEFINRFKKQKPTTKQPQKAVSSEKNQKAEVKKDNKDSKDNKAQEQAINVKISDSLEVSAIYEIEGDKKKFKELRGAGSNVTYSINPSGRVMVINEKASGNLVAVDLEGNINNCTKTEYVSTSGTAFTKENAIKSFTGYNWCSNPRFLNDENLVYLSSLPWFDGRKTQYIWMVNINTKNHVCIQGIEGENIKFNELSAEGLSVSVDNRNVILDGNGAVKQQ